MRGTRARVMPCAAGAPVRVAGLCHAAIVRPGAGSRANCGAGMPCGRRGHAVGVAWACYARRIVAGFARHGGECAGARGAWHSGGILGAWRGILARGVARRMIRGAGIETAQTLDL
jgi:hypothetical protein